MTARIRILAVYFSQTGQLERVVRSMLAPLVPRTDVQVTWHEVNTDPPFPFPWSLGRFLDAFPESVYLDPPPAWQPRAVDGEFDLVVLAYQVWFLSPSQPITAFLQSREGRKLLHGQRVITVIGCRNMWITAHATMRGLLAELGAIHVDNVVLTDDAPMWSTFLTTPLWLLTGKRRPISFLPAAGISEAAIARVARFGRALAHALPDIASGKRGPFLGGLQAVKVNRLTMLSERIGHRSFRVWGRIVRAVGRPGRPARRWVLAVYALFLIGAIVLVLPISTFVAFIASRFSARIATQAAGYEQPSGSSSERMHAFDVG